MANVSSWSHWIIVLQCDHEETSAILLSLSEHCAVEKGPSQRHFDNNKNVSWKM
jgi:hypothetical protein